MKSVSSADNRPILLTDNKKRSPGCKGVQYLFLSGRNAALVTMTRRFPRESACLGECEKRIFQVMMGEPWAPSGKWRRKPQNMALCARKISKIAAWKWVFFRLWETEALTPGDDSPGAFWLCGTIISIRQRFYVTFAAMNLTVSIRSICVQVKGRYACLEPWSPELKRVREAYWVIKKGNPDIWIVSGIF